MLSFLSVVLFFPLALFGHRSAGEKPHPIVLPKVGTMLVNTYYVTDSSGKVVIPKDANPDMPDDTLIVIRSGFRTLGKSNCIAILAKSRPDTSIISYAKNGDLFLRTLGHDSAWTRLPFGLPIGKTIVDSLPADSGTAFFNGFYMPHTRTWQVLGHDTASVGGKVYDCLKLQIVDIRNWEEQDWLQGTLYWYSPELGYFVRMNFGWDGPYFLNQHLKVWNPPEEKAKAEK